MQRWQGLDEVPAQLGRSCVVTIGVFDGVHRGHQRIVGRARAAAGALGLPVVVGHLRPAPGRGGPARLAPAAAVQRPPALPSCWPGSAWTRSACCRSRYEFSQLGPDEFVRAVLVDRLHAARVVVGENFRFGHKAAGDVALLAELGEKYDFTAEGVPLLTEDGVTISSTPSGRCWRRATWPAPPATSAARTGSRAWSCAATSAAGRSASRRRTWRRCRTPRSRPTGSTRAGWPAWTPTAPRLERWPAAISVGTNPTFDGRERTVEAYALDRDDLDLYGAHVAVDFVSRLRGQAPVRLGGRAGRADAARRRRGRGHAGWPRPEALAGRRFAHCTPRPRRVVPFEDRPEYLARSAAPSGG